MLQRLLKDQVGDDGDEAVDELVEATPLGPRRSVSGLWSDRKLLYDIFCVCCYMWLYCCYSDSGRPSVLRADPATKGEHPEAAATLCRALRSMLDGL
jgi:hypothetical protein